MDKQMYEEIADIAHRMDGVPLWTRESDALLEEKRAWLSKHYKDMKAGIHHVSIGTIVVTSDHPKRIKFHFQETKMYEKFASLSRRMDGATSDKETAEQEHVALSKERHALLLKHFHDFDIGVHSVLGGVVTVKWQGDRSFDKCVTFTPRDETQEFAARYAGYSVDMEEALAKIDTDRADMAEALARINADKANMAEITVRIAESRNRYTALLIDRATLVADTTLVDGDYSVKDGRVTISGIR